VGQGAATGLAAGLGRVLAARRVDSRAVARLLGVVALGLLLAGGAVLWWRWEITPSVAEIERFIRSLGAWGVVASVGLMVLHSFVPFPAEFLALANGMLYGPFWGTLVTWTGAMLGAFAAFGLARRLGRPFVERRLAPRHRRRLDGWADREGWQTLLVVRFLPIVAFNLVNYAAGLTRVGWWTFAWTTAVGILPVTVLVVVLGDRVDRVHWAVWLLLALACLGLWLWLRRRGRPSPPPANPRR
jgi:uncharacterized membrane protein YdjX (TVP38/TMEM64 family)